MARMNAENFAVKGKFFVQKPEKIDFSEFFESLQNAIIDYMLSKGYTYSGPSSFFFKYTELEFYLSRTEASSFLEKIRKVLNRDRYDWKIYSQSLARTRDDMPWRVKIYLYFGKFKENKGIILEIISEPAIFYKIVQLNKHPNVKHSDYTYIIYTNREFVEGIAKSIHAFTIKEARPLSNYVKTEISDKLKKFGFLEESELLEKGRKRIEIGDIENGLLDLRSAMEVFFFNLVKRKIKLKPATQDKIKANIEKLGNAGYLDDEIKGFLISICHQKIYNVLSDQPAHKREPIKEQYSLFEARLFFNLVENIFDYLIERCIQYNIRKHNINTDLKANNQDRG
ncbi:MAG TPA: hypothetical protein ENI49_01290 [Thermoplasmatales archaeon]|nr:hypothetical protein [Thermoplasmatales archaeon]